MYIDLMVLINFFYFSWLVIVLATLLLFFVNEFNYYYFVYIEVLIKIFLSFRN